jgi:cell division protein FtsI/penicillin-binding protein 2
MVVKKRNLIISCIAVFISLVVGGLFLNSYIEQRKDKQRIQNIVDSFGRDADKEYESLVRKYKRLVKDIQDYDYSYSTRKRFVSELNELLGQNKYNIDDISIWKLSANEEEDKKLLKIKSYENVQEEWFGK